MGDNQSHGTFSGNGMAPSGHKDEVPWLHRNTSSRHADPENGITDETLVEWRKMVGGQVYDPGDPYIMTQRIAIGAVIQQVNSEKMLWDFPAVNALLKKHTGANEEAGFFIIMPPFFMQFGNLNIEGDVLISPDAHILDVCPIHIGARTMIGARATIVSGGHHPIPEHRWSYRDGEMKGTADGAPIYIGRDCWIGANTTITQGVRIGDGVCIGAGSVVNKDIPNRCVAAGCPAKIVRWLEEGESMDEYIKRFENGDNGGKMGRMAGGVPPPPSRQKDAEKWKRGEGRVWVNDYGKSGSD